MFPFDLCLRSPAVVGAIEELQRVRERLHIAAQAAWLDYLLRVVRQMRVLIIFFSSLFVARFVFTLAWPVFARLRLYSQRSDYAALRALVGAMATFDALQALANVAALPGYAQPQLLVGDTALLDATQARHPVLESHMPSDAPFVPNGNNNFKKIDER